MPAHCHSTKPERKANATESDRTYEISRTHQQCRIHPVLAGLSSSWTVMSAGATRLKICRSFPRSRYDSEHIVFLGTRYKHVRSKLLDQGHIYLCDSG